MRKSRLEQLQDARAKQMAPQTLDLHGLYRLLLGGEFNPTQRAFIYSTDRIKAYKGPAGCAKTSTLAADAMGRALLQPGSKGFVSRSDYNDLMDTTKLRMHEMLARLPKGVLLDRDKSPPEKWYIQPAVEGGEPSQITFMGLKDDIVGVEANWWVIDEANEVAENRIHQINARMRAKGGNYMIAMAFNPPDKHHWLYGACTGRDFQDRKMLDPWITLFNPQPRENVHNLPDNYYENLAKTLPEDQRQRFVEGEWGTTFDGQPVYREFKRSFHVKSRLPYDHQTPLLRFWDFGYRHPVCVWAQLDEAGRLLLLREFQGTDIEATHFVRNCLAKTAQWFPNPVECVDYGDPAVAQKKDTGQTLYLLSQAGITMRYRVSRIDAGVQLLRRLLEQVVEGEPMLQVDGRCTILIGALSGGYHLDRKGQEPHKDGYYDHIADALRYGCINLFGGGSAVRPFVGTNNMVPFSVASV